MFGIILKNSFRKGLLKLHPLEQKQIIKKIEDLAARKENVDVKKLQPKQQNLYRLRVGKYRVIFEYDKDSIVCFRVDTRDRIYFYVS